MASRTAASTSSDQSGTRPAAAAAPAARTTARKRTVQRRRLAAPTGGSGMGRWYRLTPGNPKLYQRHADARGGVGGYGRDGPRGTGGRRRGEDASPRTAP